MTYNIASALLNESEIKLNRTSNNLDHILNNVNKIYNDLINLINIYEKDNKNIDIKDIENMNLIFDKIHVDISKYNIDLHNNENVNDNIIDKVNTFIKSNEGVFKIRPKIKKTENIVSTKYNLNKEKIEEIKSKTLLIKKYIDDMNTRKSHEIGIINSRPQRNTEIDSTLSKFSETLETQRAMYDNLSNKMYLMDNRIEMNNMMIKDIASKISNQMDYLYNKIKQSEDMTSRSVEQMKEFQNQIDSVMKRKAVNYNNYNSTY